jgi:anti-sigma B factor antagonist
MPLRHRRGPPSRADSSGPPSRTDSTSPISISCDMAVDGPVRIEVHGKVDFATAARLRAAISAVLHENPMAPAIVLNLAGVTTLDSAGVGALVVADRICARADIRLWLQNPPPCVVDLLRAAGIADLLTG